MILLLTGCGGFGLENTEPGRRDEDEGLSIEALDPAWGLPDEDTEVTISGTGLDGATEVFFGRSSLPFTRIDDDLVVTAPATGVEAVVDVRVVGDAGEDTLEGGFTYAESAPDPDDTGGGGPDNDGKIGGLVQLSLTQYACTACYDPPAPDIDVSAIGGFHEPTRAGWLDWLPAEGSCVQDPAGSSPASSFLDAGEWMYLTSGSRAVAMQSASDHIFASSGLTEADYVRNAGYDLSLPEGGTGLRAFEKVDALTTPQNISQLTPTELLLTNPRDAFSARVPKNNATFTWGPAGGGGSFVVEMQAYNSSSGTLIGTVVCRGPDNGSMTVPPSALADFPSGSLLVVGLHRYVIGAFDRPDDNSEVETLATFGVVGTGVLQ